jgi:hypothetical protein
VAEDRGEKVPSGLKAALELGQAVNRGIYRSPESLLHRCERIRDLGKLDVAKYKDVDVT